MQYAKNHIYHMYNRGNNSQKVYFCRDNYLFFLKKIKTYIVPYADILAWCLMPNHFHLMVYVNEVELEIPDVGNELLAQNTMIAKKRLLNDSLSIVLRSYTRAIQKQNHITGSLFQHRTKAICLTDIDGITPAWFQTAYGTIINITDPAREYPQVCFDYIHQNPVRSGLVKDPADWEFSSLRDYAGIRNGQLINCSRAAEFLSW
jgi:putative transposase